MEFSSLTCCLLQRVMQNAALSCSEFSNERARVERRAKYQSARTKKYISDALRTYLQWIEQAGSQDSAGSGCGYIRGNLSCSLGSACQLLTLLCTLSIAFEYSLIFVI